MSPIMIADNLQKRKKKDLERLPILTRSEDKSKDKLF